jgi:hypothetical protein
MRIWPFEDKRQITHWDQIIGVLVLTLDIKKDD